MTQSEGDAQPSESTQDPMTDRVAGSLDPTRSGMLISVAVGVVGVTFGVLARASGLDLARTCAMSILVFTGASQFAVVGVVGAGGGMPAALGAAILLAARNMLYGPVVSDALAGSTVKRLFLAHFIIDESAGMAAAQPSAPMARRAFLVTGIGVFVFWNLGTFLGAIGGDMIGDPARFGLDAAFPAGFLALLASHLRHLRGRVAACLGAAFALVAVPFVPVGIPVLFGALAVIPAAQVKKPKL